MSTAKYVKEAVALVKERIAKFGFVPLLRKVTSPFTTGYRPEMDNTDALTPENANYYLSQIGVLQWMVEIERIDIITEVSMLASQMDMPQEGHLAALYQIFAYLDQHHNSQLVFDPCYPIVNKKDFIECNWSEMYGNVKEPILPNAPEPRGREVELQMFIDADHAGDQKIGGREVDSPYTSI